ncbi:cysteine synthase [Desulfothermus sp.]
MPAQNVLDLIGNTPLVEIKRLNPNPRVKIYAKIESVNPGGSIKDRVALAMIKRAEQRGEISKDKIIIEATSGNTGIGLAMVCAVKGYKLMLLMPESASEERKRIMRAYGADIYLTPGHLSTDGAIEEAYKLAREQSDKYVLMDQFNNPASIDAHYFGTGVEIWEQTKGEVTHVVCALGTSGTAMGISKRLKELNPSIQIIAIEPYAGHSIQGLKNMQASYPPGIFDRHRLDKIINIDDDTAFEYTRKLAKQEGIFAGMSSGAALAGAVQVAKTLDKGCIVVIFPDGGERYLSTSLFVPPKKQGVFIFNLNSRKKDLLSFDKQPCFFTFGPSAEYLQNIEAFRRILFLDVLGGYFKFKGCDVKKIVGIADFDDQAICQAEQMGITLSDFSDFFLNTLNEYSKKLLINNVEFKSAYRESSMMIDITQKILDKGKGYEKLRSVYYDISRDREYGSLVGADLDKIYVGKTVELENYAKDNPRDFTILKRASLKDLKRGDFLKTRWGNVRPSWYLQMAASVGREKTIDLVVGGSTHYFPHMENLKSIWKFGLNLSPKIWTIVAEVKSEDIRAKLDDILKVVSPHTLRMYLLSQSYHKSLCLSMDSLSMWQKNQERVQQCAINVMTVMGDGGQIKKELKQILYDLKKSFSKMIEDDFKIYKFWPVLFDFCKKINNMFFKKELTPAEGTLIWEKLQDIASILKIIDESKLPLKQQKLPSDIRDVLKKREEYKAKRNFQRADELRQSLKEKGYIVEDTPYGQRIFTLNTRVYGYKG